jgi:hypothetical protein
VPATGAGEGGEGVKAQLPDLQQPRFVHNKSGRFESRYVMVQIAEDTPSILLQGMGGAQIGVWAAHGEGQALFPSAQIKEHILKNNLAPIRCEKVWECGNVGKYTSRKMWEWNRAGGGRKKEVQRG